MKEEELANTAKDAFYNGLREEYKPLIAHKVDKPDIRVSDLLKEVRKIEENEARRRARYPPSVSARNNNNTNNNSYSTTYKGQSDGTGYKGSHYKDNKEASWLHAELFFVLVSMWLHQQHMVSIWTPHGIHVETLWCPVETT